MNWINKNNRQGLPHATAEDQPVKSPEQSANDSLGDYLLPTTHHIVVEEITPEEYAAILSSQASPA
jgi:hypothetical protein